MSRSTKPSPSSSLASLSKPPSAPPSPTIDSSSVGQAASPRHSEHDADTIQLLMKQQQQSATDIAEMKMMFTLFLKEQAKATEVARQMGGQGVTEQGGGQPRVGQAEHKQGVVDHCIGSQHVAVANSNPMSDRLKVKDHIIEST